MSGVKKQQKKTTVEIFPVPVIGIESASGGRDVVMAKVHQVSVNASNNYMCAPGEEMCVLED